MTRRGTAERYARRAGVSTTIKRGAARANDARAASLASVGGSVTQAARLLGLNHQALIYIIEKRHRDLMTERSPKMRRKQSIIKKRLPKN